MPGRYAKNEISGGYLGSIDSYAYRMPIAPPVGIEAGDDADDLGPDDEDAPAAAQVSDMTGDGGE